MHIMNRISRTPNQTKFRTSAGSLEVRTELPFEVPKFRSWAQNSWISVLTSESLPETLSESHCKCRNSPNIHYHHAHHHDYYHPREHHYHNRYCHHHHRQHHYQYNYFTCRICSVCFSFCSQDIVASFMSFSLSDNCSWISNSPASSGDNLPAILSWSNCFSRSTSSRSSRMIYKRGCQKLERIERIDPLNATSIQFNLKDKTK